MRTSDTGAAKARSDTGSRRGAETTNQTMIARKTLSSLSGMFEVIASLPHGA